MSLKPFDLETYQDQGVVIARSILDHDDLQPLIDEIANFLTVRARDLHLAGKIKDLHEEESFDRRYGLLAEQCSEIAEGMDIMHHRGQAMFAFLFNEHLLDAVESVVGPEITCSPIQHIRPKSPVSADALGDNSNAVPWHQDAGVMMAEAENTNIVTCWLPLAGSTKEMGCLQVLAGVNKIGYVKHHPEQGTRMVPCQISEEDSVDLECTRGDVIFMHRFIPHRSLPNRSDRCRWSIDLRYQPIGQPTGRTGHPAMVVRSVDDPESVQCSYDEWCERWVDAFENPRGYVGHRNDLQ